MLHKVIVYLTVNDTYHENIILDYKESIPPFLLIEGDVSVTIKTNYDTPTCTYHYSTKGTKSTIKTPISGKVSGSYKSFSICDIDGYSRVTLCPSQITPENDCTCTFKNFEYQNGYYDCYYISEHRIFNISSDQEQLPVEQTWYSFTNIGDTTLSIPKRNSLSFVGVVEPPEYPMRFYGKVYFNNTLKITKSDVYFSIGTFYLNKIKIQESVSNDAVLFRGKLMIDTDDEITRLENIGIRQVPCGDSTRRYIKTTSSIECKCTQTSSTTFTQFDCDDSTTRRYDKFTLVLSQDYNGGNVKRYWQKITSDTELKSVTITGSGINVEDVCDFSKISNININTDLRCSSLKINLMSSISVNENSQFSFDSITTVGDTNYSNLDKKAIIQVNSGNLVISSAIKIDFTSITAECFELASSVSPFSDELSLVESSDHKVYALDRLLRVCKKDVKNNKVHCTISESNYKFAYQQCPCQGSTCYIQTSLDKVTIPDSTNIENAILLLSQNVMFLNVQSIDKIQITGDFDITLEGTGSIYIGAIDGLSHKPTLITKGNTTIEQTLSAIKYNPHSKLTFLSQNTLIEDVIETDTSMITIDRAVTKLKLNSLTGAKHKETPLFDTVTASSPLNIDGMPTVSNIMRSVVKNTKRKIEITQPEQIKFSCDRQAIVIMEEGQTSVTKENCMTMNLYQRQCIQTNEGNYVDANKDVDFTCPCSSNQSQCSIILAKGSTQMTINDIEELYISNSAKLTASSQKFKLITTSGESTNHFIIDGKNNYIYLDGIVGQTIEFNEKNIISVAHGGLSLTTMKTGASSNIIINEKSNCTDMYITTESVKCLKCGEGKPVEGDCPERPIVSHCVNYSTSGNCVECEEGYYLQDKALQPQICLRCNKNCKKCNSHNKCMLCEDGYKVGSSNMCESVSSEICPNYIMGMCRKCQDGKYSSDEQSCNKDCSELHSGCGICNTNKREGCSICDISDGYVLSSDQCVKQPSASLVSPNGVVQCNDGWFNEDGTCKECNQNFGPKCTKCTATKCLSCSDSYIINSIGICVDKTDCLLEKDSTCYKCVSGKYFDGSSCVDCPLKCTECYNSISCITCENDSYLVNGLCTSTKPENQCTEYLEGRCIKCNVRYYLSNGECLPCDSNCYECFGDKSYCISCNDKHTLQRDGTKSICQSDDILNTKCTQMMKAGTGCAICKDGFYRKDVDCQECIKNCTKCLDGSSCISCEDNFFLYNGRQCISYDMLTSCKTKTPNGCTLCEDGYIVKTPYCQSCLEVTEHCTSCSLISCYSCEENYILIENKCVHYRAIEHCSKSTDSKCSKCDFWYSVSTSGTYCQKQPVVWFIVLICILGSIIVILIIAGIV
ncbi:hypothetical protein EHI8A_153550, partial [Entamoeba histolytica HM-1:IMSS-B]